MIDTDVPGNRWLTHLARAAPGGSRDGHKAITGRPACGQCKATKIWPWGYGPKIRDPKIEKHENMFLLILVYMREKKDAAVIAY